MQRFLKILLFSFLLALVGKSADNYAQTKSPDLNQERSFYHLPQESPINNDAIKVNTLMDLEEDNDVKEIIISIPLQSVSVSTPKTNIYSFQFDNVIVFDAILFQTDSSPPALS